MIWEDIKSELEWASKGYFITPEKLAELIKLVETGYVSRSNAREVLDFMWNEGKERFEHNLVLLKEIEKEYRPVGENG